MLISVLTEKHAFDALCTLRMKAGSIDLVLADVHMSDMNGFELQKQIREEFKLPVVCKNHFDFHIFCHLLLSIFEEFFLVCKIILI